MKYRIKCVTKVTTYCDNTVITTAEYTPQWRSGWWDVWHNFKIYGGGSLRGYRAYHELSRAEDFLSVRVMKQKTYVKIIETGD